MILEHDGTTIYYEVFGEGPPVLLPGWVSQPRYQTLVKCLSDKFTVIGQDVRGAGGRTTPPPGPYTVDDMANDAAALVKALGLERVHFVGFSHTGVIGQSLAVHHPELLDRLVLTMTTDGKTQAPQEPASSDPALAVTDVLGKALSGAFAGDAESIRTLAVLSVAPVTERARPALVQEICDQVFKPIFDQPADDCMRFWMALSQVTAADRLHEVTARTLVLAGAEDRMVNLGDSWRLWRSIPGALLIGLDGIGHDWCVEAPKRVARIITSFLGGDLDN